MGVMGGVAAAVMVFTAWGCGAAPQGQAETVTVLGVWGGDELAGFQDMVAPWEKRTGREVAFTGTRNLAAILTARLQAGIPPDVAILPNPGQMMELARDGRLAALDSMLDMNVVRNEYAPAWIDLGTVDGRLYGIFMKADSKSTVWYSPSVFQSNGWVVPETWDEMIALPDRITSEGKMAPWSVAVESGEASGWPATDWIAEIVLKEFGSDVYDEWVSHDIEWTDPRLKASWEKFGRIALTPGYVPGGATGVLATNFVDGSYWPFEDPPRAAMCYLGAFARGFITEQFPGLAAGDDYSFFPFPAITPRYADAVTGGANVVVVFNDNADTRSFVEYLASAQAQQIWVARGGFTSVNRNVSLAAYPDPLARGMAEQLTGAAVFRLDADDSMPSAVQTAFWQGVLAYLQNPSRLDSILEGIETVAADAYR
jgi:alpha-glucoside transport system substrate-binding protein